MPEATPPRSVTPSIHADRWPPLLVAILLVALWVLTFDRAAHDDDLVIRESLVNQGNIAQSMGNHIDQLTTRLRFYGKTLTQARREESSQALIRSAVGQDSAFLRLIQFDATGKPVFSTGAPPEPWLLDAALVFAAHKNHATTEDILIGMVPPEAFSHAWNLPVFLRPTTVRGRDDGFVMGLIDLGYFLQRFENIRLGRSGEILLIAADGRELLRMHEGRLWPVGKITATERLQRIFAAQSGTLTERVSNTDERLYVWRRTGTNMLSVLVSRTRHDVLSANKPVQRGYLVLTLLITALMLFFTWLWYQAARRQKAILSGLTLAQQENAELIEQLEKEKQVAYRLATHDKLTGLANRMLFAEIASRFVARAQRSRGRFAVLFVDLDRFKPINDTHGHKAGDQLLIEVAKRLEECMRQTDMVARFGGDEFVALVSDLSSSQGAAEIASKIVASLTCPFIGIVDDELSISPSIGIAMYPDDADSIEVLLRQADAAMYQAKSQGRATYVFADPALNRRTELMNKIEAALPAAIKLGEIEIYYQPKVALQDYRIVGLEALARWNSPQLGAVAPSEFIPVAEKSGVIVEFGEYVIQAVCQQIELWWRAGMPLVPVAVNVSPRQLRSPRRLYSYIESTLASHGVAPRYLEIEITETGLIDAGEDFVEFFRRLDGLGIHLAIDDFGTGFSGLNHLRALPAKHLKIDRSFIRDIRNDINDAAIVSSTIALAHNLHLLTIAEGVETKEQLAHLRAAGCDQAQGYLFSHPLPAAQVEPLLQHGYINENQEKGVKEC